MGGGRDGIGGGIVRKKTKNKLFDEIKNLAGVTFFHFRGRNEEGTREKERMGAREGKGMGVTDFNKIQLFGIGCLQNQCSKISSCDHRMNESSCILWQIFLWVRK